MNLETKRQQEKRIVSQMIRLYCRGVHGGKVLCPSCAVLLDYACQRIDNCPFVETKTSCASCEVHCYKPQMREQIRTVMRYAGPRMMLYHPVTAIRHLMEIKNEKVKRNRNAKYSLFL